MVQATSCPDAPTLRRFLLGQAGEQESAPLEEHLLHCDQCLRAVRTLPADDPLISALREGRTSGTPAPQSGLLEKLRLRLREMEPASRGPDTISGENTEAAVPGPTPSPFEAAPAEPGPALAPAQLPDEIGRLGGYRILAELGRGGMGVVYKAEDPKLKRLVALKAMLPRLAADPGSHRRFLREAQAMAAVRHDHVVTVYQVDEDRGVPFLAMEFLQGLPLDQWLKEGRKPSMAQVLRMGREIAEGLAAAHERGLIHRDVKPGNIWLDSAHKGRVKILDFGLARAGTEDVHLTRTGAIVGTPAYMAPEQARGEKVDARCDLFSLGCVLYKLCTGVLPFAGDTTTSLLMALALDHPRPVRDLNPGVPPALADLVMRLLAKKPEERPASAREVARAIQAVEGRAVGLVPAVETKPAGTSPAARPTPEPSATQAALPVAPRVTPPRRRVPALVALLAVGALAAAAVVAVVIIIRNKNGDKVAEVNVPPGGSAVFADDAKKGDPAEGPKADVDDAWVKEVSALPAEKQVEAVAAKLKELNPGFDGKVTPTIEGGVVTGLQFLTNDVTDVSPVKALTGLRSLTCSGTPGLMKAPLADLSPLQGMPLTTLSCETTRVADLSPLKGMQLMSLDCLNTLVTDLSPLQGMPLTALSCNATRVADLSPLKDMRLITLNCSNTKVSDLSPLKDMKLTYLVCGESKVSDLSPLKGMPLMQLQCTNSAVSDLSPLKGMPLKEIVCDFKPGRDAAILRSIPTLEQINNKPAADFWKDVDAAARPPVDDAWVKLVASLPAAAQVEAVAAKLKERNPGFDGKVTPTIEGGVVTGLQFLTEDVTDISPVLALPGLRKLGVGASNARKGRLSDLSPLKGMSLQELNCAGSSASDLSVLKGMPLTNFNCNGTALSDLSPLKGMKLATLYFDDTKVSDLSPLKGMPLMRLQCSNSAVSDLSPLKGMPLTWLECSSTKVSDLSPLKEMKLTYLAFASTPVSDLSPLKGMPLTWLGCSDTPVFDLSPVTGTKLTTLVCGGTRVSDLSPLKGMPLTQLDCIGAPVFDLSPLKGMPLKTLNCGYTKVSDLSPLEGMKLTYLDCDGTSVSDLSALKDMKLTVLYCYRIPASDLSALKGMPLQKIGCDFKPGRDAEILRSLKTLETINDKPAAEFWNAVDANKP